MIYLNSNDVLLFQGDSITHGGRIESETDLNHVIGHGYQDTVAQRLGVDNIERRPRIENRAVSGDQIEKITARAERDIFDIKPTIMSILDGSNEASSYIDGRSDITSEKLDRLFRKLLDDMKRRLPGIRFIICQPWRYVCESAEDQQREKQIAELTEVNIGIVREIARDYGAIYVPFKDALDSYMKYCPQDHLVWDGDHPTYVGHGILADCWFKTVEAAWGVEK